MLIYWFREQRQFHLLWLIYNKEKLKMLKRRMKVNRSRIKIRMIRNQFGMDWSLMKCRIWIVRMLVLSKYLFLRMDTSISWIQSIKKLKWKCKIFVMEIRKRLLSSRFWNTMINHHLRSIFFMDFLLPQLILFTKIQMNNIFFMTSMAK